MSGIYRYAQAEAIRGNLSWTSHTIRAFCVDASYTPDFANHKFLTSLGSGSRVGSVATLTSKTVNDNGWGEIWLMDESGSSRKQLTGARPEGSNASGNTCSSAVPSSTPADRLTRCLTKRPST